jgi:DNA repair protein RecO (recombination protein O)
VLEAIVVGGVDYGDADRIVHLLTKSGRLSVFAHGARKSKKRFAGALEPFNTIAATIEPRSKGGLATMSSASVDRARLGIQRDLLSIALAGYVVELGAKLAPEGDAAIELYTIVVAVLDRLDGPRPATRTVRQAFELVLMQPLGYRPEPDRCVECGGEPAFVDFSRGGALCRDHGAGGSAFGPKTAAWMRALIDQSDGFDELAGFDQGWAETAARKLTRPLQSFYRTLLDQPLRSAAFLEELSP